MERGCFITFEGIDGCGKSTQINLADRYLQEKKIPHILTREPGGTPLAEKIRSIILSPENGTMHDSCELLLYLAARAQHVQEKIRPALEDGMVVLCDRFQEATYAYQGFGRGIHLDKLKLLNGFATGGLVPARTFIFDIPVDVAFDRMHAMNKIPDRLEQNSPAFYQKIREGYLALAAAHPSRIVLIQGDMAVDRIFNEVKFVIDSLLNS
jgi:dTMP kinase